jgi:hypothetical protein
VLAEVPGDQVSHALELQFLPARIR